MMMYEKCIDIHGEKYFKKDLNEASASRLKLICSIIDKKEDLLWIKTCCKDVNKHIVDDFLKNV